MQILSILVVTKATPHIKPPMGEGKGREGGRKADRQTDRDTQRKTETEKQERDHGRL